MLKPDVVFFGENVPRPRVASCFELVSASSALVVLGSSLTVMSGLRYVRHAASAGVPVVIVNQGPTRGDSLAAATIDAPLGATLTAVARELGLGGLTGVFLDLGGMRDAWAVIDERELVGLLYRADWTRLSLTGRVRGSGQFPPTNLGDRMWSFRGGPPRRRGRFRGRCGRR